MKYLRLGRGAILMVAFLTQNITVALTFGLYGVFVQFFSTTFDIGRTVASAGLPIVILTMGLTNPWMGWLIARLSIRGVMLIGACVMSMGFGAAAVAPSAGVVLLCFVPIGVGYALLGIVPATTLVANWFDSTRGRAIGLVNTPLGGVLMPPLATMLFLEFGWRATFAGFALLLILLLPLLGSVRDRPEVTSGKSRASAVIHSGSGGEGFRSVLSSPFFWVVTMSAGIILASGSARSVHIVPYAMSIGIDTTRAALLMSLSAFGAVPGALMFGALSDRFGGSLALALNGAVQVLGWVLLLGAGAEFVPLGIAIFLLGICSGGVYVALSTMFSIRYGTTLLGTVLGLASAVKLPFTFSAPILIAWLFDLHGNYMLAFTGVLVLVGACAAIFSVLAIRQRQDTARKGVALPKGGAS